MVAAASGTYEALLRIIRGFGDMKMLDGLGRNAFHIACKTGN